MATASSVAAEGGQENPRQISSVVEVPRYLRASVVKNLWRQFDKRPRLVQQTMTSPASWGACSLAHRLHRSDHPRLQCRDAVPHAFRRLAVVALLSCHRAGSAGPRGFE